MELLTEVEAAAIAKVSKWTIRRMVQRGRLKAANYGTAKKACYRIHPDDLRDVNVPQISVKARVRSRVNSVSASPQPLTPLWA